MTIFRQVILLSGDDDCKIWRHAARYGRLKLAVIPCNGEEIENYARTLEKLFKALIESPLKPLAYKLRDRDNKPVRPLNSNSVVCVGEIRLNCRESENLYLCDEVLQKLGIDWNRAKDELSCKSKDYGEKSIRLGGIVSQDRRDVDLKGLMEELVCILDPNKRVDWRIRVAQCIGERKPEGQLKEFLGEQIIPALWG